MAINFGGLNLQTTSTSSLVSGSELEKVSQEIFGSASKTSATESTGTQVKINVPSFSKEADTSINIFNRKTDIQTVNQVAVTKTRDVQISNEALQNIQALKTAAAKTQTSSAVHQNVDGKLHLETKAAIAGDFKSVFELSSETPNIFKSGSLDKDKRGSNSLAYTNESEEQESEDAGLTTELNIFA